MATLVGCNPLLGIGNQDHPAGAASGAAGAGAGPDGGASTASAGSGDAGAASLAGGSGGQAHGGAGDHPAIGTSGAGGDGAGGDGAGDVGVTIRVAGKVENLWGYPLNGVAVNVRSASGTSSSVTDASGAFSVEGVATPYEASFVVHVEGWDGGVRGVEGWAFQGLTRGDPVFRVERGGRESFSTARLDGQGLDLSLQASVGLAVGTPYGQFSVVVQGPPGYQTAAYVNGPETVNGRAHALAFLVDSGTQLPTSYLSYATQPIHINTDKLFTDFVTLDLSPPTAELTVGAIAGAVTGDSIEGRENALWLMFESNAAMPLAYELPRQASFSYTVPALPSSTLMVSASVGRASGGVPLAIGYRGGLVPGQSGIEVRIPEVASPTTPLAEAAISAHTAFSWQTTAAVSVLVVEQFSDRQPYPRRLHVVAAGNTARIPDTLLEDMNFDSTEGGRWTVESHGDFSDVDATVNETGFISPFFQGQPDGPLRASGWYARSRAAYCGFSP